MEQVKYVLGFAFSMDKKRVVLIEKKRPDWQKGKCNGIGGKIEEGESSREAMVREFYEETSILTELGSWQLRAKMKGTDFSVEVFSTRLLDIDSVRQATDEFVLTQHIHNVQFCRTLPNVPYLIELALDDNLVLASLNYF